MRFLSEANNEAVRNKLFATMSGGVEVQADRFGINPDSKLFRNIEAGANAASNISKFYRDKFYLLEINTQPGMTDLSLVPEIAEYKNISFDKLIKKLILDASINK